ncbi:hypothetical protein DV736_g2304, partial [Chaetothyriales sp. CBS 134916]
MPLQNIAIIGAGLGGLGAALALHSQGFKVTVYEQASPHERFAGAIMLSPNGLRILDKYGLYDGGSSSDLKKQGHSFQYVDFQDDQANSTSRLVLGDKHHFEYDALRIYRNVLRTALETAVRASGIPLEYGKKAAGVVEKEEDDEDNGQERAVRVSFADGSTATADLLVAADGIHSKIRALLFPGVVPVYQRVLAVCGAVEMAAIAKVIPPGQTIDGPIAQSGKKVGAFVIAPQRADGSELLAGTQREFPQQDRAGWERIAADKAFQRAFLEEGMASRTELMQVAIRNVTDDSLYTWPMHTLPRLERWASEKGRVVLIGDAAHAIPPTTGQGANQALEDGAPLEEQQKLNEKDLFGSSGAGENLRWLYEPKIEERVDKWVEETKQKEGPKGQN